MHGYAPAQGSVALMLADTSQLLALLAGALAGGGVFLVVIANPRPAAQAAQGPRPARRAARTRCSGSRADRARGRDDHPAGHPLGSSGHRVRAAHSVLGPAVRRRGRGARRHRPAGGASHLDRVPAGHDRGRGRSGAGHPSLAARRRPGPAGSADHPGGPAAYPGAAAGKALRRFADDLDDPSADLVLAALIINARLRDPGLRTLLGALSGAVREELDMRRRIEAQRKSTRFSANVRGRLLGRRGRPAGRLQPAFREGVRHRERASLVLVVIAALYAAGFYWLTRLARFDMPERILVGGGGQADPVLAEMPETVGDLVGEVRDDRRRGGRRLGRPLGPVPARSGPDPAPGQPGPADRGVRLGPHAPERAPRAPGIERGARARPAGRLCPGGQIVRRAGLGVPLGQGEPVAGAESRSRATWPKIFCACSA